MHPDRMYFLNKKRVVIHFLIHLETLGIACSRPIFSASGRPPLVASLLISCPGQRVTRYLTTSMPQYTCSSNIDAYAMHVDEQHRLRLHDNE